MDTERAERDYSRPMKAETALRLLQQLDAQTGIGVKFRSDANRLFIGALDALGEALGLECTGTTEGGGFYSHNGDTCPIHEWLVPDDSNLAVMDRKQHAILHGHGSDRPLTNEEEKRLDQLLSQAETTVSRVQAFLTARASQPSRYPLLDRLREAGFRVMVHHLRVPDWWADAIKDKPLKERIETIKRESAPISEIRKGSVPHRTGGYTLVEVFDPRGVSPSRVIAKGEAVCSMEDAYVKRVGLTKALGRLTSELYRLNIDVVP